MSTATQAQQAVTLLNYFISKGFQPINVFRYDKKLQTIYIQAGESDEIAVVINSDGRWNLV